LPLGEHRCATQVSQGKSVAVGRHQAEAVSLGGHQDAGEDRPGVVVAGGTHDLAQGVGQGCGVEGDLLGGGVGQAGEVVGRQQAHGELRPA